MIDIIAHLKAIEVCVFSSDPTVPEDYLERARARLEVMQVIENARQRQNKDEK